MTRSDQRIAIAHRQAFGPIGGQDAPRTQRPMRHWDLESRVAGSVFREFRRGSGLQAQVLFAGHRLFEMAHHVARAQAAGAGRQDLDQAGAEMERVDVALERSPDAGADDLDRDLAARLADAGAMDLRDGGGCDRFGKFAEQLIDGGTQLCRDGLFATSVGKGGRRSCSMRSCPAISGPTTSARVDRICPNFI